MSHADARLVLLEAYAARGIAIETTAEVQAAQAIGLLECQYGSAKATNNWGCVQLPVHACNVACDLCTPMCPPNGAPMTDTHADGSKYCGCFKVYPTPVDGAGDLLHELYRRAGVPEALRAGDPVAIANAMHATHYFEAPPSRYARAIEARAQQIAAALHEPWEVRRLARRWGWAVAVAAGTAAAAVVAARAL